MKDFELESLTIGGEHSQKVKAPPIVSDYSSKDCVNLSSSTAVSRIIQVYIFAVCYLVCLGLYRQFSSVLIERQVLFSKPLKYACGQGLEIIRFWIKDLF